MRQIYIVLGVARSGTSVMTRGLMALGVALSDNLHPADSWNPKGFWEDDDIAYKINRSVLCLLDYPWINTELAKKMAAQDPMLMQFKHKAKQLLDQHFAKQTRFGFKDPRNILMLPFWQSVFQDMDLDQSYVIAIRHPLGCAHSNEKINNGDVQAALLTWLTQTISAVCDTQGKKRVLVSYENLMQDAKLQLTRIYQQLGMRHTISTQEIDEYANQFIDNRLRHHVFQAEDLLQHPGSAVLPLCVKVYALLMQVANDEISFDSQYFQTEWQQIMLVFENNKPLYAYLYHLFRKEKQIERELRSIKKSIPYKLIWPLLKIDHLLRRHRKTLRIKRKLAHAMDS